MTDLVIGGTATITRTNGISVSTKIGAGNGGIISEPYETHSDLAALIANLRKNVYVTWGGESGFRFRGEIKSIEVDRTNKVVTYSIEEISRKLLKTRTGYTVPIVSTFIHRVEDDMIYNIEAAWTVNAYANKVMSFIDNDFFNQYIHCLQGGLSYELYDESIPGWTSLTADVIAGSVDDIWFEDPTNPTAYGLSTGNGASTAGEDRILMEFQFKTWDKDDVEWDDVYLDLTARFTAWDHLGHIMMEAGSENWPRVEIWNYTTTAWVTLHQYDSTSMDGNDVYSSEDWVNGALSDEAGRSPIVKDRFDILAKLGRTPFGFKEDYVSLPSSANSSGFKSSRVRIRVLSFRQTSTIISYPDPSMEVHYIALNFSEDHTKVTKQQNEIGYAKILSNTANSITLDDTGFNAMPNSDGTTMNDAFIITSNLEVQLAAIINAHTYFSYSDQLTGDYTGYTEPNDIFSQSIASWLDKICATHNWFWSYNPSAGANPIEVWDTIVSTGKTLTIADELKDMPVAISYDVINIRENVYVYGFQGLNASSSPSVEYASTLGNEDITYNDNTLMTKRNIDAYAASKKYLHEDADVQVEFPLSLDNQIAGQDYHTYRKGQSIIVDDTILAAQKTLFIHEILFQQLPPLNREILILVLRTRKLS